MSFSTDIKNEITRLEYTIEEKKALLSSLIKINGTLNMSNKAFIEPYDFLMMKNKKNSRSYYTIYINKILQISDLILEKPIV